jgi:O-antigen ligase/tetratricopeptide (TPR) repeat protein
MVLIGGSDAGRFVTAVRAMSAMIGAVMIAAYLLRAPSRHDVVDLLVLGGLLAFLATCVTSSIPRLSFEGATTAIAYAAAFYVAREAVADARGRQVAITVLGVAGTMISVTFFAIWAGVWFRWMSVPGAGLPPFDLQLPATPYRHYYLVGMVAALLMPATLLLARRPIVWPIGVIGATASAAVAFMSGSRTVWLAGILAVIVAVAIGGRVRLPRLRWIVATAIPILAVMAVVFTQLLTRVVAASTVEGRLAIWNASIDRWLESPIVGFGPGTFTPQLALGGYDKLVPHGHNAVVQNLVEGGVLGLIALALVCAALIIGIANTRPVERAALGGIAFFAVASLSDNPSITTFLVIPVIVWAAIACPRRVSEVALPSRWRQRVSLGLAAVVGLAALATLAASWSYERASAASTGDSATAVTQELRAAVALDPSHALYRRDLAAWLFATGRTPEAEEHLQRALELNPADVAAWRAAAILAADQADGERAMQLAKRATDLRPTDPINQMTFSYVARQTENVEVLRAGLVRALRFDPWLAATAEWRTEFPGDVQGLLQAAHQSWSEEPDTIGEHLRARSWLAGMVDDPLSAAEAGLVQAAASAAIDCRLAEARGYLGQLPDAEAATAEGLLVRLLVARAAGEPAEEVVTLASLRLPALGFVAATDVSGASPFEALGEDVHVYGRWSLGPPPIGPILPTSEAGLSAWLRDPVAAARRGAPDSGLATCR